MRPMPLVDVDDTRLYVESRGPDDAFPVLVLHGGPGLDHTMFGDLLDPLGAACRLLFVDQRAQGRSGASDPGTWTLARMAAGGREPPRLTNVTFTSLAEAEWHVFKLRWKRHTGQDLLLD